MSITHTYSGVWPVAPTPFTDTGALDPEGMKRVLDCMIDQGVDGICILANFSEQFLLSDDERDQLTRLSLEHVDGRVPVIVTASHFATEIVVARAKQAADLGAAMIMLMPPYHGALLRGTPDQIIEQFAAPHTPTWPAIATAAAAAAGSGSSKSITTAATRTTFAWKEGLGMARTWRRAQLSPACR